MFKRIGIIAKEGDARIREALRSLVAFLQRRELEILLDQTSLEMLGDHPGIDGAGGFPDSSELIIAVGGDGTLLSAAHMVSEREIRVLGINLGRLGFLADITPQEIPDTLGAILDGQYQEERRSLLAYRITRDGKVLQQDDAVNDVVVQKWNIARLIGFDTYIDGTFVHSQRSDGMIIATPTGSTAYALSGGGPILHPSLDAMVLVPICPHTLTNRPIVVDGNSRIEMVMGTRDIDHARLTCDGDIKQELIAGDRVLVHKSERSIRLIHPAGHNHFATLRAKLRWGTDLC